VVLNSLLIINLLQEETAMKKFVRLQVLCSVVCLLLLAAPIMAEEAKVFKLAHFYAADHPMNIALKEKFVPMVEEGTNGRYKINIYDSSQLGGEREFTEGVRLGTIEMGVTGGLLSATYPKLKVLELPYLFKGYDHVWSVLTGPLGDEFEAEFDKAGLKILAWVGNGLRVVSNSKRAINSLEDIPGIRLRVPQNKIYIDTAKALGFSVVTMGMPEVFNALNQGVMDGQENPFATLYASKWYEVQKYVAVTYHIFSHGQISMNKGLWESLPAEDQEVFLKAAEAAAEYEFQLLEEGEQDIIKKLEEAGLEITYPDMGPFREATKVVRDDFVKEYPWGKELIDNIMAVE
jgi:tripartite ATP-independent transporter DctP family solute receptor